MGEIIKFALFERRLSFREISLVPMKNTFIHSPNLIEHLPW